MSTTFETRSQETMIAWARLASYATLLACRAEAARELDRAQVNVINAEINRRGL